MLNKFRRINHSGYQLGDLTQKVIIIKNVLNRYTTYFDYYVKDGERIDTVAHDYYGSSDYAYLIVIVNNIMYPHRDWPLSYHQFNAYMRDKYGKDYITTQSQTHHYKWVGIAGNQDQEVKTHTITDETYSRLSPEEKSEWQAVSVYDWETELNESKRHIKLISNRLLPQIDRELKDIFG